MSCVTSLLLESRAGIRERKVKHPGVRREHSLSGVYRAGGACTPAPPNTCHPVCLLLHPGPGSALWDFSKFTLIINMPGQMRAPRFGQGEQHLNPKLSSIGTRAGRAFDEPRVTPCGPCTLMPALGLVLTGHRESHLIFGLKRHPV